MAIIPWNSILKFQLEVNHNSSEVVGQPNPPPSVMTCFKANKVRGLVTKTLFEVFPWKEVTGRRLAICCGGDEEYDTSPKQVIRYLMSLSENLNLYSRG